MDINNGFKMVGISVRTTNQNNQAQGDLEKLWSDFFANNVVEKVSNKISNDILVIYTEYKSNYTEEYTTVIGFAVSEFNEISNELVAREFPKEDFKKYIAKGIMPNAVVDTWMEIWKNDKDLNRKYTYDMEVYGEKSQNGENSEVDIYIGVK